MSSPTPMIFSWDGEAMVPMRPKLADREFVIGETYRLGVIEDRSPQSHSHFFAALNSAWQNLPEDLAERFPSAEALRKYALIRAGYADERSVVCASKAEAARIAAFIRPMDDFSLVTVKGATIVVYTAKSQSMKAMGKEAFQDSKQKVLDIVSAMIGHTAESLQKHAGAAA